MRILVLRGGALGDFLVTLPALARLRERWPVAGIELVGNAEAAALALPAGLLNAAHSQHEARWAPLYSATPLPPPLAAWLREFDLVINYWPDPGQSLASRFPARPGQQFITADALPSMRPAAAHYCEPLGRLRPAAGQLWHPLRTLVTGPVIVALHPGSGSSRKNWPLVQWLGLARWLEGDLQARVVVVSGPAEPAGVLAGVGRSLRNLPLNALADELARCTLFIGHDSGVSHLAAAAGASCLLLFGPTDPAMWAPPAPHVRVLRRGDDLALISLEDVQQAVQAVLRDQR